VQQDIRQTIGWTVSQAEIEQSYEKIADTWVVVGQSLDDESRIRVQRSWIVGRNTGRLALVLQYSPGQQPFPESIVPGVEQLGVLAFFPGALGLRAKFVSREGTVQDLEQRPPTLAAIDELLKAFADCHAKFPWLTLLGHTIRDAMLVPSEDRWALVDDTGHQLPVAGNDYWRLLAISGGQPADIAGEWDGHLWRPVGMFSDGRYWVA
jgi:hypothetical protein